MPGTPPSAQPLVLPGRQPHGPGAPSLAVLGPDPRVPVPLQLYQELRFRVVLVGLDIWNHEDKIDVSSQASATLDNFLTWRKQHLLGRHPHDNAQLIT